MRSEKFEVNVDCPFLGVGIGIRTDHYAHVHEFKPKVDWFEALSENYMGLEAYNGGPSLRHLLEFRKNYPIVLHGVSLSVGSTDPIQINYLKRLKELIHQVEPTWVSDHLCWTGVHGQNLHDLLPLPYTEEPIHHVVDRVKQVQDFLGRRLLLENVSSYVEFNLSQMQEWEFLREIANQADCGILLDINNIYVSSQNHGYDAMEFLNAIPPERVGQIHLAGHSRSGKILVDTHDHPVPDPVWDLYRRYMKNKNPISTLIEWDAKIPEFSILEAQAAKAKKIALECLV